MNMWNLNQIKPEFGRQIWNWYWQVDCVRRVWVCVCLKYEEEEQENYDDHTDDDSSKYLDCSLCVILVKIRVFQLRHHWHFGPDNSVVGDWPVHCRMMLLNTPGFYLLDASSIHPTVIKTFLQTIANVPCGKAV